MGSAASSSSCWTEGRLDNTGTIQGQNRLGLAN